MRLQSEKMVRKGIFYESNVFAKGAVINANNELHGRNSYPYTIICEGRVGASMWMDTSVHGSKKVLMLAKKAVTGMIAVQQPTLFWMRRPQFA